MALDVCCDGSQVRLSLNEERDKIITILLFFLPSSRIFFSASLEEARATRIERVTRFDPDQENCVVQDVLKALENPFLGKLQAIFGLAVL